MVAAHYLPPAFVFSTAFGSILKLVMGILNMNPMTITLGFVDLSLLAWALTPGIGNMDYFEEPSSDGFVAAAATLGLAGVGALLWHKDSIARKMSSWFHRSTDWDYSIVPDFLSTN